MTSKKPFAFKSSALSSATDQLWSASKKEFKAGDTEIKLDLGKTLAEKSKNNARSSGSPNNSGFVFGSKITERVIVDNKDGDNALSGNGVVNDAAKDGDQPKTATAVFESILKRASSTPSGDSSLQENDGASTSLKEETKDSLGQKSSIDKEAPSHPKTIVVETGEENEVNVHHAACKLFEFDPAPAQKKFVERGLANLRINRCSDAEAFDEHRIVGRTSGNQRVIINSRIFPNMLLEKVSPKRLKFSALKPNSEIPIIFLAMASEYVIEQLYMALHDIVEKAKDVASRKRKASNGDAAEEKSPPKKAAVEADA